MITKRELLKNIRNYTAQEIANAVRDGVVSLYDLNKETEGAFTPLLKRQVKAILETPGFISGNTQESVDNTISHEKTNSSLLDIEPPIGIMTEEMENKGKQTSSFSQNKPAMFSRMFSFKGRIRRLEYGLTYLAYCIWNMPMQVIPESQISEAYAVIYLLSLVPILWIFFAQGAKRCHDRGNSGWFQIIPFYGFWMIFAEGESNTNQYGESPK